MSYTQKVTITVSAIFFYIFVGILTAHAQTAGLVGHWAFDEGSGTTAGDTSGNGLTGTISGATWTTGKIGGALNFNGTGNYVNVGSPAPITNLNTFTWSAWVKTNGNLTKSMNPIIEKGSGSSWLKTFYLNDSSGSSAGQVHASIRTNGTFAESASINNTYTLNTWEHWAVTYNDSGDRKVHIYKNGVEISYASQTAAIGTVVSDTSNNMYFGATPDTTFSSLNGVIDDVYIYNRVLALNEIQSLATSGGTTLPPTSDTTAPSVPASLSATAISSSQINLSWTASTDNVGVTGYNVYRNGIQIASVANTSYNDTALTASTLYTYTVQAYDAAGNPSAQSGGVSATTQAVATTPDTTPPSVPTNLFATAISSSQINLSWTASTDNVGVTGYDIYRDGALLTTVTTTSYSNTSLSASTAYTYYVRAKDAAGNFAQSASVSATTQAATTTPPTSTSNGAPVILYTDITSGPNTGGEGNNGAYLSIFGKNFGSDINAITVTVGGGSVARKVYLGASRGRADIQQLSVQLGSAATTGAVRVTVSGVGSNTNQTFTVRAGNIYFVATNGNNANTGTFASPWLNLDVAKSRLFPGDFLYAMNGVSQTVNDTVANNGDGALRISTTNNSARAGTLTQPITLAAYPGATVTIGNGALTNGIRTYLPYWTFSGLYLLGGNSQYSLAFDVSDYFVSGTDTIKGLVIVNNDITSGYYGLEFDSVSDSKVIGNKSHDTPHTAFYYGGTGVPANNIEYGWNQIYNVGPNIQGMGSYGIKLYYAWTSGPAPANRYLSGVSIHDNIIHDIVGSGVLAGGADWGGYAWLKDVTVYNNIIYTAGRDSSEGCFSIGRVGLGETLMDLVLYNNTIYNCPAPVEYEAVRTAISRNNIFYPSGVGSNPYFAGRLTTGTFTLDHNLYFNGAGIPNQDTVPVIGNPLFVSPITGDVHLQSTSPAKDAGISSGVSTVVTMDYDTLSRPQGLAYDIGAYEYASGGTTTPPPTPTVTLTANPVSITSGNSSTLSWSSTNATSCTGSGAWTGTKTTSGTQSLTNLTTTGTYTLSCTGTGGTTTQSATVTVTATADTTAPTQPQNLTASAVSTTQINLSWTASTDPLVAGQTTSGISGYRIYRSGVQIATSPTTSYSNTGLTTGTTYSYTVAAVDGATPANISPQSSPPVSATTQSVITLDTTPPTVSLTAPIGNTTVSGTVTVSSTATDNIGVAGVQFKLNNANLGTEDTTSPYSTSWNTTSVTNGFHTILAVARDAAGNRATSTAATIFVSNTISDTTNPIVIITTPTALTTYTATTGTVIVGGTATDNIGVTQVSWSNSAGGTGTMTGTANWSATLTLQSGVNIITITGRDAAGNIGTDSITVTYTPIITDTQVPTAPANLSAIAVSTSQINLSWTASTDNIGVTGYKVFANGTQIATTTTTSYSHQNLSLFTTYAYTISAYDAAGNTGTLSSPISVTTQAQATTQPPASSGGSGGSVTASSGGGSVSSSGGGTTSSSSGGGIVIPPTTGGSNTGGTTATTPSTSGGQATVSLPPLTGPFSIGMNNNQVKLLQQMLIKDGSLSGEATGYYGALTQKAVEVFQTKYNLITSGTPSTTGFGLAGPSTRAKLNALYAGTGGSSTDRETLLASLRKQVAELTAILQTLIAKLAALRAAKGIIQ